MKKDARIEFLGNVWLFERCSRAELANIASVATPVTVPASEVLAVQGDSGSEFFILVEGEAEATRGGVRIAVLRSGSFFGEMSLLDLQPRSATVTTCEPCELLVLTQQAFTTIVNSMPAVDRKMLGVLATRLRDLEDRFLPVQQCDESSVNPSQMSTSGLAVRAVR
jgi:CRP-like cAMP-binding protein